jgi:hypothetical protein
MQHGSRMLGEHTMQGRRHRTSEVKVRGAVFSGRGSNGLWRRSEGSTCQRFPQPHAGKSKSANISGWNARCTAVLAPLLSAKKIVSCTKKAPAGIVDGWRLGANGLRQFAKYLKDIFPETAL